MADKRITELNLHTSLELGDVLPIVNSSETKKSALGSVNTFIRSQNTPLTASSITVGDGNIVPTTPQGATLGTIDKPFRDIFLQSGSISIESDTPGDPSAIISNNFGNLEISVGGMLLIQPDASFIAPTGSFSYLSGSFNHIGSAYRVGDTVVTGSVDITGSFEADLQENYVWLGDSNNRNAQVSLDTLADSGSFVQSAYISLYSTQSQQLQTAEVAQPVTFSNIWTQKGVSLVSGSQIVMEKAGTYQFNFVAQLTNTQNAVHDSYFWIKYNGNNFPNSSTQMSLPARKNDTTPSAQLMTVNIVGVAQNDGDYIELYWTGDSDTIQLSETPGDGVKPETPSVIANIVRVG